MSDTAPFATSTEVAEHIALPSPLTGELLQAIPVNAARVRQEAGSAINRLRDLQAACDDILAAEAMRQGTKTLRLDGHTVTLTGGKTVEYDTADLMANLMECGCPPERINEAVQEIVTYRVNRAVLRQLAAANENYAEAIEAAQREVEKPWRASVK